MRRPLWKSDDVRKARPPWPPMLHFLAVNAATGSALGTVFAIVLIATNTAGLGDLIAGTSNPVAPVLLMIVGFATLFGGLYTGSAVMLLPWRKNEDGDD